MAWTKQDQMAYIAKRRTEGTILRVTVDVLADVERDWQAYAESKGMKRATMIRDCIRRCMELDGWTQHGANHPGADRTEPTASDPAQAETVAPGADTVDPVKRKRGRPRKVQAVDMGADGMKTDAHNNADAVGIDAGTIAPPSRKRGGPRKVKP